MSASCCVGSPPIMGSGAEASVAATERVDDRAAVGPRTGHRLRMLIVKYANESMIRHAHGKLSFKVFNGALESYRRRRNHHVAGEHRVREAPGGSGWDLMDRYLSTWMWEPQGLRR